MSHTPGPWVLRPVQPTSAYVNTPCGGFSILCNGLPERAEWTANAHLIAAAPELLAALKAVLPAAEHRLSELRTEGALLDAERAIAKAEGRNQ